ncbi:Possible ABC transport system periplasmic substrate-binding protein [hydrothermal vent metagenome]|uniref:Possible ABC transport system periplasmic substrate-binding protein n=1 Tax=hydrothermal vent metagenome TaxID=652676 RepID=A0A1W1BHR1_9ZZZZ
MYSRVNYTLIGVFVILFSLGILYFAFWLGGKGSHDDNKIYMLRMKESISGLSKDSGVKLKGVNIGTVKEIRVNPKNIEEVEILLSIDKDIPIKEDMKGVIKMFGLTGLSYIEIEGGSNGAKSIESKDGEIPLIKSGDSLFVDAETRLKHISDKLADILDRGDKLLSDENIKNLSSVLKNTDKITAKGVDIEDKVASLMVEVNTTIKEFRVSFNKLAKGYDELALNLKRDMPPLTKSIKQTSDNIDRLSIEIEKTVKRGDYNFKKILQPSINDIEALSEELSRLTRELRQSPSDILFKSRGSRRGPGE